MCTMADYNKQNALKYLDAMAQSNAIESNPLSDEERAHLRSMIERGLTSEEAMIEILQKHAPSVLKRPAVAK